MWIVKVHGASPDLGFAFFAAAALFYGVYVFGAVVLTYAAWYQVPGPWRALRIATWSITVPVAVGLVAFCYATASGWRFPDGPGGHELAWASAPAWLILVVVVMFGYALLLHVITRLPAHRRPQTLILGALAFLAVTGVIVMPFLV